MWIEDSPDQVRSNGTSNLLLNAVGNHLFGVSETMPP